MVDHSIALLIAAIPLVIACLMVMVEPSIHD
jgi:hypothetical protein